MDNPHVMTYLDHLGEYAMRYVRAGQTLGLGTGRAAAAFIRALGGSRIKVRGVPTSNASAELAESLGIELAELRDVHRIDIDFDGADEVDPRLNLIKGNGGALVREKIVAAASRRRIILVGDEKLVKRLGAHGNLPVEVVPFAAAYVARRIRALGMKPKLRLDAAGGDFITDNHNIILDCGVKEIRHPRRLEEELLNIPGVVGTGLFVGVATTVLVASQDGKVATLRPKR